MENIIIPQSLLWHIKNCANFVHSYPYEKIVVENTFPYFEGYHNEYKTWFNENGKDVDGWFYLVYCLDSGKVCYDCMYIDKVEHYIDKPNHDKYLELLWDKLNYNILKSHYGIKLAGNIPKSFLKIQTHTNK